MHFDCILAACLSCPLMIPFRLITACASRHSQFFVRDRVHCEPLLALRACLSSLLSQVGADYPPITSLCVHRGPQPPLCCGHCAETQTPSRPLEPLCACTVVRGQPPHHHPPSVTAISSPSPTLKPTPPPSSFQLPHPSSPTNPHPHHAAIPLPCHLAAFHGPCTQRPIVCAGRRQKAVYSQSTREKGCVELK